MTEIIRKILRILSPRSYVDGHPVSKLDHVRNDIAWDWDEVHERGADVRFYTVKVYEHKDTGEEVYKRRIAPRNVEFRTDPPTSADDTVRYKDAWMVLPQETDHVSHYE